MFKRLYSSMALRAAIYYFVAGAAWILLSDWAVFETAENAAQLSRYQTLKGWFFVFASAILVFAIFKSMIARVHDAEKQLRETESLRKIGQAAASIVHDLKNQMQVIQLSLDLMEDDGRAPRQQNEFREIIQDRISAMLTLSQGILDYSRGETKLEHAVVDVSELCRETVLRLAPLFESDGISLSYRESVPVNKSLTVMGDKSKLERVIVNLLTNSRQACPRGCSVVVKTDGNRDSVELEVQDDGPGVAAELRDSLFEPFVTRNKEDGTGLGLAIVKNIVESHGGSVTLVKSDKGACFRMVIPRLKHEKQGKDTAEKVEGEAIPVR